MARFPRIDSPCPLSAAELSRSGDFDCTHCHRHVHDLSALDEAGIRAFLAACEGPVCVRYARPRRLAATALASAALVTSPLAAAAQGESAEAVAECMEVAVITVGGIENPREAEFEEADAAEDAALPQLPVISAS